MTRARDLSRAVNNKMTVFKYTATAGQTTFTGADAGGATLAYDPNSIIVTYNGIILESVSEYTATNGTSVVLTSGATVGAEVNILAFEDVAYSGVMPTTGGTFTGNVNVNGNVGVGTTSPDRNLHVKKTDAGGTVAKFENSAGSTFIEMASSAGGGANGGYIEYNSTKDFKFAPGDTNRMTIKADGKVGIGTESPIRNISVIGSDTSSSGYKDIAEFLEPNITGGTVSVNFGVANSLNNLGKVDFTYAGAGSTSNRVNLGFHSNDNKLMVYANGEVRMPSNPCAVWGNNSGSDIQLHGHGGWYDLPLTHAVFNIGGHYNTSNYRFTAPIAGVYHVWFSGEFTSPGQTTWTYLAPRINGSSTANLSNKGNNFADFTLPADAYQQFAQNWYLNLAEGDWFVFSSNGSGGSILAKSSSELLFGARLMQ